MFEVWRIDFTLCGLEIVPQGRRYSASVDRTEPYKVSNRRSAFLTLGEPNLVEQIVGVQAQSEIVSKLIVQICANGCVTRQVELIAILHRCITG